MADDGMNFFDQPANGALKSQPYPEEPPPPNTEDEYGTTVVPFPIKPPSIDLTAHSLRFRDLTAIPPRQWIYGRELIRRFVSVLGSTGGVGKTTYSIAVMLSVATGIPLLAPDRQTPTSRTKVHKRCRVWLYNLEDPMDELDRRIAAALKHFSIPFDDAADWIYANSGRDDPLIVAHRQRNGELAASPVAEALVKVLIENRIDVLIVDPFVQSHDGEENRNDEMNLVMALWGKVAHEANCVVWLVHHFRKGTAAAGDAENFRGAGAIQGAARSMYTISPMSSEEAEKMGIPDKDRRQYIRHDEAKSNMAPMAGEAAWLKLVSVPIDNATDEYPDGDWVQVVEPHAPISPWEGIEWTAIEKIMDMIEAGPSPGEFYAAPRQSKERWAGHAVMAVTGLPDGLAAQVLDQWKGNGVLETGSYASKAARRQAACVRVNVTKLSEMRRSFEALGNQEKDG